MDKNEEISKYAKIQYSSSTNLEKRQNLWTLGDNKVQLGNWIFQHLNLQEGEHVLEIGCGKGLMWIYGYYWNNWSGNFQTTEENRLICSKYFFHIQFILSSIYLLYFDSKKEIVILYVKNPAI